MGNRVFGCDDCQLVCPWNKYAQNTDEPDFAPRHNLDSTSLLELFAWSEEEWEEKTRGSALRRAGFAGWLRNIAVGLGNAPHNEAIIAALRGRLSQADAMVAEHIAWALDRQLGGEK
jgi:epoxyqueuosine reductase